MSCTSSSADDGARPGSIDDLTADARPEEIETLCMNCEENGVTRMLLTRIPHFREIVIMAFECPHCNWRNSEVQFSGAFQEHGVRYSLNVRDVKDMSRQVVKSDSATFKVPALDFEIPATAQRGQLSTIEGLLSRAVDGLVGNLPLYRAMDEEHASKVEEFVGRLRKYADGDAGVMPFQVVLDDPGGNSYIENYMAPERDPEMKIEHYARTAEQDEDLGFRGPGSVPGAAPALPAHARSMLSQEDAERKFKEAEATDEDRINILPGSCANCGHPGEVKMVVTDIPHFKEIVLMAFNCEECGYKTNEVKAGGAISERGRRHVLRLRNFPLDLNRDLLKSHTASFGVPELMLELTPGTLGGRFTTIEGLLTQVKDELSKEQFVYGDSGREESRGKMAGFFENLDKMLAGECEFTVILDDPLANSYIQNVYAPDEDPAMIVEEYERTAEQNDELGITDMKTENYY